MYENKLRKFLDGELGFDELQKEEDNNAGNNSFVEAYKKVIKKSENVVPDFNPFERVESVKIKRISRVRIMLPFAASILLLLSLFLFVQNKQKPNELVLTEAELKELKQNTEFALLYFSKEWNSCMACFEEAKKMHQPVHEIETLKNIKLEFNNPVKNLKIK